MILRPMAPGIGLAIGTAIGWYIAATWWDSWLMFAIPVLGFIAGIVYAFSPDDYGGWGNAPPRDWNQRLTAFDDGLDQHEAWMREDGKSEADIAEMRAKQRAWLSDLKREQGW